MSAHWERLRSGFGPTIPLLANPAISWGERAVELLAIVASIIGKPWWLRLVAISLFGKSITTEDLRDWNARRELDGPYGTRNPVASRRGHGRRRLAVRDRRAARAAPAPRRLRADGVGIRCPWLHADVQRSRYCKCAGAASRCHRSTPSGCLYDLALVRTWRDVGGGSGCSSRRRADAGAGCDGRPARAIRRPVRREHGNGRRGIAAATPRLQVAILDPER